MKEVVWHSLYNHYKTHQVVGWVAKQLANEVHRVYPGKCTLKERFLTRVSSNWLLVNKYNVSNCLFHAADLLSWTNFSETVSALAKPKLRLLLVSDTTQTPILLSAISLRFRGELHWNDLRWSRLSKAFNLRPSIRSDIVKYSFVSRMNNWNVLPHIRKSRPDTIRSIHVFAKDKYEISDNRLCCNSFTFLNNEN